MKTGVYTGQSRGLLSTYNYDTERYELVTLCMQCDEALNATADWARHATATLAVLVVSCAVFGVFYTALAVGGIAVLRQLMQMGWWKSGPRTAAQVPQVRR
jgi:hypothetical protein